jgi:hypothetical protein
MESGMDVVGDSIRALERGGAVLSELREEGGGVHPSQQVSAISGCGFTSGAVQTLARHEPYS